MAPTPLPAVPSLAPDEPTLVIVRGNSGSGKTTTAREVRRRYGRGCALIEQDHLRRIVLREHGGLGPAALAPAFITGTARAALDAGYHVILEGILHTGEYGDPLRSLITGHAGPTACFYLDVSFEETVRRHRSRVEPIVTVTADMMRDWYTSRDLLSVAGETVIPETTGFPAAVEQILHGSGLTAAPARTPCPARCPRCAAKARPAG